MTSIFQNHENIKVDFYIIYNELSETAKSELNEYVTKNNGKCFFIEAQNELFEGLKYVEKFPLELYYKLIPHVAVPDNVDRIIFLDVDMVVDGNLEEVYNKEFPEGCCFFACRGVKPFIRHYIQGVKNNYINSGFLLANLKELRKRNITIDTYKECISNKKQTYYEEELFNKTLINGEVNYLFPFDYNYNVGADKYYTEYARNNNIEMKKIVRHYLRYYNRKFGKYLKPWEVIFPNKTYDESDAKVSEVDKWKANIMVWWKYAKNSPYYDELYNNALLNTLNYYEQEIEKSGLIIKEAKEIYGVKNSDECNNLTGVAVWEDEKLIYLVNGRQDENFTGLAITKKGTIVYFKNGIFQSDYTGIIKNQINEELLIIDGKFVNETGVFKINGELLYFEKGIRNIYFSGTAKSRKGRVYYFINGVCEL